MDPILGVPGLPAHLRFTLNLIIEVDGYSHTLTEIQKNDNIRDNKLNNLGYTIIRFTDDKVLNDIENVKRSITGFIDLKTNE